MNLTVAYADEIYEVGQRILYVRKLRRWRRAWQWFRVAVLRRRPYAHGVWEVASINGDVLRLRPVEAGR